MISAKQLTAVLFLLLAGVVALANDDKKACLPAYVLRAETVIVLVDPDAGISASAPLANQKAREDVEKALMKWGRFRLVLDAPSADLVIVVRKGSGKVVQPTISGVPTNDRPVIVQPTDSGVRLGGQKGRPVGSTEPAPQDTKPAPQIEAGTPNDMFVVYQGGTADPLSRPAAWRYINKDSLKSPSVPAVAEFRKAVEEAEKRQKSKP
jgi:hypothetical protein